MSKSSTSVRRLRSSRTHRSKLPRTARRAAVPIVGHNVPGPSAPVEKTPALAAATAAIALAGSPTTRASLGAAVKERFHFSIDGLWDWLVQEERLPPTLPEDWDPILGDGGVYAHWRDSGHDILPTPTIDVPKSRLGSLSKARARATRAGRKQACRLCGIASVLWRCWLATRPRRLGYVEQYESTLAELGRSVAKTYDTYVNATKKFAACSRATGCARWGAKRLPWSKRWNGQTGPIAAIRRNSFAASMTTTCCALGFSPIKKLAIHIGLGRSSQEIMARLDILRQITVGFSRNDLGQPQRWAGSGRQPDLMTAVWKTLWDQGFTYREIGENLACPGGEAIDYAASRSRSDSPTLSSPEEAPIWRC